MPEPSEQKSALKEGEPRPEDSGREEKEFLARGEIKTMKKDIAALREGQAVQEREKVAEIKTEEEIQKERERQERARQTALERETAEKLAQSEALRRARQTAELLAGKAQEKEEKIIIAETEEKVEGFRGILKETQAKEEQERKAFLERVSRQAGEAPALGEVRPEGRRPKGAAAQAENKILPKEPSGLKPSLFQKLWIRIILTLLILAILGAIGTFWYWYLAVREKPAAEEQAPQEIVKELVIPPALISTEASRTLKLSFLNPILQENLGKNQFTRLIVKDSITNEVLGLKEFFDAFEVKTPANFYNKVDNDFTLFVYSSQDVNRLGLVVKIKEPDLLPLLRSWEATMEQDLESLSVFLGKTGLSPVSYFRETKYKNASFRYLSFPPQNFGICWTIVNDYFVLTFSGESIIKTIDKINE